MSGNRDRVALACFLASAVLAGGNGVSIRFSNPRASSPLGGRPPIRPGLLRPAPAAPRARPDLLALVPLATLLLAVIQRQERLRVAAVIGTPLTLAGVAVISQGPVGASVPVGSLLAAVASAGVSRPGGGDLPMLQFAGRPGRPSLRLLVLHDDPEREFDYVAGAERALEHATAQGWTVVSIQHDWATVFDDANS
jgi:hypothetical protein